MASVINEEPWEACGGTLISSKYILSEARCMSNRLKKRFTPAIEIGVNTTFSHFNMGSLPHFRSACFTHLSLRNTNTD